MFIASSLQIYTRNTHIHPKSVFVIQCSHSLKVFYPANSIQQKLSFYKHFTRKNTFSLPLKIKNSFNIFRSRNQIIEHLAIFDERLAKIKDYLEPNPRRFLTYTLLNPLNRPIWTIDSRRTGLLGWAFIRLSRSLCAYGSIFRLVEFRQIKSCLYRVSYVKRGARFKKQTPHSLSIKNVYCIESGAQHFLRNVCVGHCEQFECMLTEE